MKIQNNKKFIKLKDIKPYKNNARKHSLEQIAVIVESIKTNGYLNDIVVDKNNTIICGHGRREALNKIYNQEDEIQVIDGSHLTPKQVKKLRILDNKISDNDWVTWDDNILKNEIESIYSNNNFENVINEIGFDVDFINDLMDKRKGYKEEIEDEIPEIEECLTINKGDIIELGKHRLMCGDSVLEENFNILMNDVKANMYFTDPPYSVNYSKKAKEIFKSKNYVEIKNDDMDIENISKKIWSPVFKNAYNFCADNASFYLTMPQGGDQMRMMNEKWQVKHQLIWVKDSAVFSMNRLDYDYMHEPIAYGWKKKHNFYRKGEYIKSVWNIKRVKNKLHPTMKPVQLIENAINNSTMQNCIILDTFVGSGSTLIACEKTNRICYGMEIDRHYCSVIIERYCKYVNNYNIKINGKEVNWNEYKNNETAKKTALG